MVTVEGRLVLEFTELGDWHLPSPAIVGKCDPMARSENDWWLPRANVDQRQSWIATRLAPFYLFGVVDDMAMRVQCLVAGLQKGRSENALGFAGRRSLKHKKVSLLCISLRKSYLDAGPPEIAEFQRKL
jgi:hypothetical protein